MEFFLIWIGFGVVTAIAAASRGRSPGSWLLLGFLFSIFALAAVLVMPSLKGEKGGPSPDTHVKCPDCRELVLKEAKVCKHCGCKLIPQP